MKREERSRRWERHMAQWPSSGLTQRAYCERESISYASFKNWRLVIKRERGLPNGALRFIPVRPVAPTILHSTPQAKRFNVAIRLRGERVVALDDRLDEIELGRLIRLLEVLPC